MSYTRLYHKFSGEFPAVFTDDHALATWVRLLLLADASWPMRPPLPRSVRRKPLDQLVGAGLVTVTGDEYTVRGLDAERTRRRNAGLTGAAKRWQNDGNANASGNAMPSRDRAEQSKDEPNLPPPPAGRGRRKDKTNPRARGTAPRQNGHAPRDLDESPRQERQKQKTGPTAVGEILRRVAAQS